eukprot:TRINITY_DN8147_c1_g1_i1.p1 TRINITY_DN8147_c1_g1~~TRINITY_DN8147_c1_g1_i1.p1  ORF type:complete len:476 (+),score=66.18 TRINITY_DN8147_c1_g1_i1:204-1430(+)
MERMTQDLVVRRFNDLSETEKMYFQTKAAQNREIRAEIENKLMKKRSQASVMKLSTTQSEEAAKKACKIEEKVKVRELVKSIPLSAIQLFAQESGLRESTNLANDINDTYNLLTPEEKEQLSSQVFASRLLVAEANYLFTLRMPKQIRSYLRRTKTTTKQMIAKSLNRPRVTPHVSKLFKELTAEQKQLLVAQLKADLKNGEPTTTPFAEAQPRIPSTRASNRDKRRAESREAHFVAEGTQQSQYLTQNQREALLKKIRIKQRSQPAPELVLQSGTAIESIFARDAAKQARIAEDTARRIASDAAVQARSGKTSSTSVGPYQKPNQAQEKARHIMPIEPCRNSKQAQGKTHPVLPTPSHIESVTVNTSAKQDKKAAREESKRRGVSLVLTAEQRKDLLKQIHRSSSVN